MFKGKFIFICTAFEKIMDAAVPSWFVQYLIETRANIMPLSENNRIKITEWQGHSINEIEAHLHALHMSLAGLLFNSMLSEKTGMVMTHECGCNDCFYPGTIKVDFPNIEAVKNDYINHVVQQKQQLGVAA
jgi:hypothetical protein